MNEFLDIALAFPTVLFSGMLVAVLLYWLMAIAGAVDIDLIDIDLDIDGDFDLDVDFDPDVEVDMDTDVDVEVSHGGIMHAMMAAIGLGTVPVTIIGSIVTLIAWFLCFATVYYLGPVFGTGVFVGVGMVVASLLVSLPITSIFTHPLKGIFKVHTRSAGNAVVGKLCKVTSGRVTESFGQASVDDGGAGLLVSIRCESEDALGRGDEALIIDYDADNDVYFVEPYKDLLSEEDAASTADVVFEQEPAKEAEEVETEPIVES